MRLNARRHDWVYLRSGTRLAFGGADTSAHAWVEQWIARGGPLVVTRQYCADGRVALGAVLPLAHGRVRVACTVDASAIAGQRGPVTVAEAASVLPERQAAALCRLADAVAGHAVQLGVYGSTAWQYFGAQCYRHAQSDVDVICDVASSAAFNACLDAFADAARYFPSRIDGELRFAGGHAVAWRELHDAWHGGAADVLAKGERDIALLPLRQILSSLR